jgi:hypothetical protein
MTANIRNFMAVLIGIEYDIMLIFYILAEYQQLDSQLNTKK